MDCIERSVVVKKVMETKWESGSDGAAAMEIVAATPAADVAPVVHARWDETDWVEPDGHGFGTIRTPNAGLRCTRCTCVFKKELLWKRQYCPGCGAKMGNE